MSVLNTRSKARGKSDITIRWIGANQKAFTLYSSGPHRQLSKKDGVWVESFGEGFYFSPLEVRKHSTARQRGATLGSVKYDARLVDIHGYLAATDNRTISQVEREWWESWDPDETGRMVVTSTSGTRWVDLRLDREPKVELKRDPHRRGVLEWDITAVAGWPFWQSESELRRASSAGLEIVNPGDVPAYPRFVVSRLWSSLSIDIPGMGAFTVSDPGQGFVVDTDPLHEPVVLNNGSSGYAYLTEWTVSGSLPTGYRTVLTGVTDSRISCEVDANWRRPW